MFESLNPSRARSLRTIWYWARLAVEFERYQTLMSLFARLAAAARLVGPKRLKVYGKLDQQITRQAAPVAAERTYNNRYIFSSRVNPKSLVYQGIYQDWSIPALALK